MTKKKLELILSPELEALVPILQARNAARREFQSWAALDHPNRSLREQIEFDCTWEKLKFAAQELEYKYAHALRTACGLPKRFPNSIEDKD